jgi:hypothetical protein
MTTTAAIFAKVKPLFRLFTIFIILGSITAMTEDQVINIQVSPNVLNLLNKGTVVTVHTDIDYSLVRGSTVTLNGIEIKAYFADDCGDFVAKFNMDQVKALPNLKIGEYNTLTMTGETNTGNFIGSEAIMVVNNVPKK